MIWPGALAFLLIFAVCTLFVTQRWAVSVVQAGVFLLTALWIVKTLLLRAGPYQPERRRVHFSFLLVPLSGALLWGNLQYALGKTVYPFATANAILYWLTGLCFAFLGLQICADREIRSRFLGWLLTFGFVLSIVSVLQLYTAKGQAFWMFQTAYTENVLGPFVYRNNYAAFMELLLPIAVYRAIRFERFSFLYTAIAGAMYASVIASASRAGSALATLEIVVLLMLAPTLRRGLGRGWVLRVMAALAGTVAIFGYEFLWERLSATEASTAYAVREEYLRSAFEMVKAEPVWGFGLGTWPWAYREFATFSARFYSNHAHNEWMQWAAEGGIPFAAMLLIAALWTIRPAVKSLWGIGILSVLVHSWVDYPFHRTGIAVWIFTMWGVLAAHDREITASRANKAKSRLSQGTQSPALASEVDEDVVPEGSGRND
jgi:O-antigen ligase